jgi:hypothetical protein
MRATGLTILACTLLVQVIAIPPAVAQRGGFPGPGCSDRQWFGDGQRFCETRESTMPGGSPLEVDAGRNGSLWVRASSRGDVLVRAQVVAHADTDARARAIAAQVQVVASGGRVSATGPEAGDRDNTWWAVNFSVDVPQGTPLTLNTRNGGISLQAFNGQAQLHAVNGPVRLENVGGEITGDTRNGPVVVDLEGAGWVGTGLNLETRNGPVRVTIPEGYSAELELEAVNGPVRVDHPDVPIARDARRGRFRQPNRITTTLGAGGAKIRATTVNGPLTVQSR